MFAGRRCALLPASHSRDAPAILVTMMHADTKHIERQRSKARLLSSVGALFAGVGVGMLLPRAGTAVGSAVLAAGILAHLAGMIGNRRSELAAGYSPATWENFAYWLCWVMIAAALVTVVAILA